MSRIDNETFYSRAIQKYGCHPKGVHWNSQESQQTRFEVIHSFIQDDTFSILDVGCGFGDFFFFLQGKNMQCDYQGIDLSPSMVSIAKEQTGCEISQMNACYDELPICDYLICSGAMNILTRFDTFAFIRNCFASCNKAFIFNLLMGKDDSLVYNHFYPSELQELFDELGAKVSIVQGYLEHDFTVCLEKV